MKPLSLVWMSLTPFLQLFDFVPRRMRVERVFLFPLAAFRPIRT